MGNQLRLRIDSVHIVEGQLYVPILRCLKEVKFTAKNNAATRQKQVKHMEYSALRLSRPLRIQEIVTVHYFEYASSYSFPGESHDFWEFLYVDKGSLFVTAGQTRRELGQGELIFHAPGEFHALEANGTVAPNLVVISFLCSSPEADLPDRACRACPAGQDRPGERLRFLHAAQRPLGHRVGASGTCAIRR